MQDEVARSIGLRVRAARSRLGMTRRRLAQKSDVSERYLSGLETGAANASIGIIARLATALDVNFDTLVTGNASAVSEPAGNDPFLTLVATMSRAEREAALTFLSAWLDQRRRSAKGVALLGLRGAGKTTLGSLLAERTGLPFVSVTREIEGRAGMSLADLFNLGGPDAYRVLENDVIAELVARPDRIVLETAGGIVGN